MARSDVRRFFMLESITALIFTPALLSILTLPPTGQWQKMALALALMSQAPFIILDEPTATIDAEAEADIFRNLQRMASGTTTLLIAHRFATVRIADRIVVMDQGCIIEKGSHQELMTERSTKQGCLFLILTFV